MTSTSTLSAEKSAPVLARVQGTITAINREEGDLVKEGEVLLSIEQKEYAHTFKVYNRGKADLVIEDVKPG